jgi:hypothetical protein
MLQKKNSNIKNQSQDSKMLLINIILNQQVMKANKSNAMMNNHPVTATALIDIFVFTSIFWMILKNSSKKLRGHCGNRNRRGNWVPSVAYLPVLLFRWALVPHKNWMSEHKHRDEALKSHMNHHHYHHHHHGSHQRHPVPEFVGQVPP